MPAGDLALGVDGLLYVTSDNPSQVLRFGINGSPGAPACAGGSYSGIAFGGPGGDLYIVLEDVILRCPRSPGQPPSIFATPPAAVHLDVAFGPDGGAPLGVFAQGGGMRGPLYLLFGP